MKRQVRWHEVASDFLDTVAPVLRRRPTMNQLPLAIAKTCVHEPGRYGPDVRFATAWRDDVLVGAALQTPPWHVQLAECDDDAAAELGRAFVHHAPITGVAGPDAAPERFAAAYAAACGVTFAREMMLGTFELQTVAELPPVPGRHVAATLEHAEVVQAWLVGFHDEATPTDPAPRAGQAERAIASGRAHLWLDDHGQPVAFAFTSRDVEGWASVGPVYTPRELRGRGYATAVVAALSRYLLARGRIGCTLFTNLANPTSNAIYERIGYRRVGISTRFGFGT